MGYQLLSLSQAINIYSQFPVEKISPYHHPAYVLQDAKDKGNAEAIFFYFGDKDNHYYHPLHKIITESYQITDLESARGYGGPVSTSARECFLAYADENYQQFIKDQDICVEFIRLSPLLNNQEIYVGECWRDREVRLIDLSAYSIEKQEARSRGAIKKAMICNYDFLYEVNPDQEIQALFIQLYRQRMGELSASKQYRFTDEYFAELFNANASLAYLSAAGEMVSAAMILEAPQTIEYHLSCSTEAARRQGATNLLLHLIAERFANRKSYFHLGGGTDSKDDNSLLRFKKSVGNVRRDFYIGKRVHKTSQYASLRQSLSDKNLNRVIFYRD